MVGWEPKTQAQQCHETTGSHCYNGTPRTNFGHSGGACKCCKLPVDGTTPSRYLIQESRTGIQPHSCSSRTKRSLGLGWCNPASLGLAFLRETIFILGLTRQIRQASSMDVPVVLLTPSFWGWQDLVAGELERKPQSGGLSMDH